MESLPVVESASAPKTAKFGSEAAEKGQDRTPAATRAAQPRCKAAQGQSFDGNEPFLSPQSVVSIIERLATFTGLGDLSEVEQTLSGLIEQLGIGSFEVRLRKKPKTKQAERPFSILAADCSHLLEVKEVATAIGKSADFVRDLLRCSEEFEEISFAAKGTRETYSITRRQSFSIY
jgi:hypothetical protein